MEADEHNSIDEFLPVNHLNQCLLNFRRALVVAVMGYCKYVADNYWLHFNTKFPGRIINYAQGPVLQLLKLPEIVGKHRAWIGNQAVVIYIFLQNCMDMAACIVVKPFWQ